MKHVLIVFLVAFISACQFLPKEPEPPVWRLAIHGGAGVITPDSITPEQEAAYRAALVVALEAGAEILREGGSSLDAVQAAIVSMENDPLFNAGHGAVFTADSGHELDAAIMSGSDRNAGAVAGVKHVRNPILAARAVMDHSEHVMFAGAGADDFARRRGLQSVENTYFDTDHRRESLVRVLDTMERASADKTGTVGAVAIDLDGNVAAGTSTGGMTAKTPGRVGDTPLIGAATYAQNGVCAVSSTGHGELFIRVVVAKAICNRMASRFSSGQQAARKTLQEVAELGGNGGVVVMNGEGSVSFEFNSPGMYRGLIDEDVTKTAIYAK